MLAAMWAAMWAAKLSSQYTRYHCHCKSRRPIAKELSVCEAAGSTGAGGDAIRKACPKDQTGIRRPDTACDAWAAERDGFNHIYVDSACTLWQAIITARDQSTRNQCEHGVPDSAAADIIWLTQPATVTQGIQITVSSKIIVEAQSHSITRTAGRERIFLVNGNADFTLRNITITGGTANLARSGAAAVQLHGVGLVQGQLSWRARLAQRRACRAIRGLRLRRSPASQFLAP